MYQSRVVVRVREIVRVKELSELRKIVRVILYMVGSLMSESKLSGLSMFRVSVQIHKLELIIYYFVKFSNLPSFPTILLPQTPMLGHTMRPFCRNHLGNSLWADPTTQFYLDTARMVFTAI